MSGKLVVFDQHNEIVVVAVLQKLLGPLCILCDTQSVRQENAEVLFRFHIG